MKICLFFFFQCLTVLPIQQLKQLGNLTTNCLQDQRPSLCTAWTPASCCCWPTVCTLTITACCCPCSIITTGTSLLQDSVFIVLYFLVLFLLSFFEKGDFVVITSIPVFSLAFGSAFQIALMNTTVTINMSTWSVKTTSAGTETNIYLEAEEWDDEKKSLF